MRLPYNSVLVTSPFPSFPSCTWERISISAVGLPLVNNADRTCVEAQLRGQGIELLRSPAQSPLPCAATPSMSAPPTASIPKCNLGTRRTGGMFETSFPFWSFPLLVNSSLFWISIFGFRVFRLSGLRNSLCDLRVTSQKYSRHVSAFSLGTTPCTATGFSRISAELNMRAIARFVGLQTAARPILCNPTPRRSCIYRPPPYSKRFARLA
jgi:hypothetical protein